MVERPEAALERSMLKRMRRRSQKAPLVKNMYNTYNYFAFSVIGWFATMSLGVVGYLISLEIQERRQNRRMDAERERLGLNPS